MKLAEIIRKASDPNITPEDAAEFITSMSTSVVSAVVENPSLFLVVLENPGFLVEHGSIHTLISNYGKIDAPFPDFLWQAIAHAVDIRSKNASEILGLEDWGDLMVSCTGMRWFFNNPYAYQHERNKSVGAGVSPSWVSIGRSLFNKLLRNEPRPSWRITSRDGNYWAKWEVSGGLGGRGEGDVMGVAAVMTYDLGGEER